MDLYNFQGKNKIGAKKDTKENRSFPLYYKYTFWRHNSLLLLLIDFCRPTLIIVFFLDLDLPQFYQYAANRKWAFNDGKKAKSGIFCMGSREEMKAMKRKQRLHVWGFTMCLVLTKCKSCRRQGEIKIPWLHYMILACSDMLYCCHGRINITLLTQQFLMRDYIRQEGVQPDDDYEWKRSAHP